MNLRSLSRWASAGPEEGANFWTKLPSAPFSAQGWLFVAWKAPQALQPGPWTDWSLPKQGRGSTRNPDVVGEGPHILCFQVMRSI